MKLIEIGNNVLVNLESIDAIELVDGAKGKEFIIYVNGKRFTATNNIGKILQQIVQPDLSSQFFAG